MDIQVVNLLEKAGRIQELHSYTLVAQLNEYPIKIVKGKREFVWHRHEDVDELFMVVEGKMKIELRPGPCLKRRRTGDDPPGHRA